MLNRSASLAMSTSLLKALPGKLDIKRRSPSIVYILASFAMSTSVLKASPGKHVDKRHSPSILYIFQINHLEEALKVKEEGIEDAHQSHEDQLNKLTTLTKERETSWQKQKEEIEIHYQQMLDEMQSRVKVKQIIEDLT